jgi:mRNA interferase RelE/StbE
MSWTIVLSEGAQRDLGKIGRSEQIRITLALSRRIATLEHPRQLGEALTGRFAGLWRYRVGDFRIIAKIEDEKVTVLVVAIGHRSAIYR